MSEPICGALLGFHAAARICAREGVDPVKVLKLVLEEMKDEAYQRRMRQIDRRRAAARRTNR